MERLGLTEAIGELRQELAAAIAAAGRESLQFEVGQIELELQTEVELTASGGFKFWVVEASGGGSNTATHTIRVPLTPRRSDGRPILTGATEELPPAPEPRGA